MIKKKSLIISLIFVLMLSIILPVVNAADEEQNAPVATEVNVQDEKSQEDMATSPNTVEQADTNAADATANLKKEDIYLTGDNVTIDYIVDGNLFVIANSVTIDSQIGGDAFIIAKNITVNEQSYIYNNIFAVTDNLDIKGVVYDVYAMSKVTTISGYVYRDLKILGSTVNIYGTIGRNAFISGATINFNPNNLGDGENPVGTANGIINGNLNYWAAAPSDIPKTSVTGAVTYKSLAINLSAIATDIIISIIFTIIGSILLAVVVWLLALWLAPKFSSNISEILVKKPAQSLAVGVISILALSLISIVMFLFGFTQIISFVAISALALLVLLSTPVFSIAFGTFISDKLKLKNKFASLGIIAGISFVICLINLIPIVSVIVDVLISCTGVGLLLGNSILRKKLK